MYLTVSADGRTGPGPSSEEEGLYSLRMSAWLLVKNSIPLFEFILSFRTTALIGDTETSRQILQIKQKLKNP